MNITLPLMSMNAFKCLPLLSISFSNVAIATLLIGGTGAIIGIFLGLAAKKLEIEVDEKEQQIRSLLPGNNCGACGFAGCDNCAQAIAAGNVPANACPIANNQAYENIAEILGSNITETEKKVAFVKCAGTCEKTKVKYNYYGIHDCKKAALAPGKGPKQCSFGCMGFGSCVKVCQFDAIHVIDGIAVVDKDKCASCGLCTLECPNHLIEMAPYHSKQLVRCSSNDKGKDVKSGCSVGCIGCMMCTKVCEFDAIHVESNLARIDYSKCTNCGKCAEKCPTKIIYSRI